MPWGGSSAAGHGTVGPKHGGWVSGFLRADAERQAMLLGRIADRLDRELDTLPAGQMPSDAWIRAARLRLDGFKALAMLELESAKLRLLAERAQVKAPMSDEEFQAQIESLARKALGALSVEELEAELARKRALPPAKDGRP